MNVIKWLVREIHRSSEKFLLKILYKKPVVFYSKTAEYNSKLKKVAIVDGCPDNRSDRYRVDNIAKMLSLRGITVDKYFYFNLAYLQEHLNDYDLLIIFRAQHTENNLGSVIDCFKSKNIPVAFDTDDLIFCPEILDDIAMTEDLSLDRKERFFNGLSLYRDTMLKCDVVTVTTEFLRQKAYSVGMKNVFVIKNTIDEKQYNLAQKINKNRSFARNDRIKICYLSGTATHNKDFKSIEKVILKLLHEYKNLEFHIVGHLELADEFEKYKKQIKRKKYMNYLSLLKYSSKMDINIAPLEMNNPYNEGKSEIKIFEAALVKLPSVVSSTSTYSKCITNEVNGFVAQNADDWYKYLKMLIDSKQLRMSVGQKAYEDFAENFYLKNNAAETLSVFEGIYKDKELLKTHE